MKLSVYVSYARTARCVSPVSFNYGKFSYFTPNATTREKLINDARITTVTMSGIADGNCHNTPINSISRNSCAARALFLFCFIGSVRRLDEKLDDPEIIYDIE